MWEADDAHAEAARLTGGSLTDSFSFGLLQKAQAGHNKVASITLCSMSANPSKRHSEQQALEAQI